MYVSSPSDGKSGVTEILYVKEKNEPRKISMKRRGSVGSYTL